MINSINTVKCFIIVDGLLPSGFNEIENPSIVAGTTETPLNDLCQQVLKPTKHQLA